MADPGRSPPARPAGRSHEGAADRPSRRGRTLATDRRGVSPVVAKTLEVGVVVLFVGLLSMSLYGNVVPEYRTAVADRVAERTAAAASERIEQAVPPNVTGVRGRVAVDLPPAIRGERYSVAVENRTLVVDHPRPGVAATARLALPESVVAVRGNWTSDEPAVVVARRVAGGVVLELSEEATA